MSKDILGYRLPKAWEQGGRTYKKSRTGAAHTPVPAHGKTHSGAVKLKNTQGQVHLKNATSQTFISGNSEEPAHLAHLIEKLSQSYDGFHV